jgi:hypothetical protein
MEIISDSMTIILSISLLIVFLVVGFGFTRDKNKIN